jgi:hypothetical protein
MWLLALVAGGAGHGSFVPMALLLSPFWAGYLVWPCIFVLVALRQYRWSRFLAGVLLVISYVRVPWTFPPEGGLASELQGLAPIAGGVVVLYLLTQLFLWWRILRVPPPQAAPST